MKSIVQLLNEHGISPTQQRVEIAQALLAKPQHLSADQVLNIVNRDRNIASKATVYNTLGLFAQKGLIREVIIDLTKVFYDSNTENHYHFYNVDTGELQDLNPSELDISHLPVPPEGTVRDGIDVIVRVRNSVSE